MIDRSEAAEAGWRGAVRRWVEHPGFQRTIIWIIAANAVTLGLETWPAAMAAAGPLLIGLDRIFLVVFTVEIAGRLIAHGGRFFRDPWSVFDFIVVGIALVPASGPFSVLRALRVLRTFRLVSAWPRMRRVVGALLAAIPGLGSIAALLLLVFYVFAVMATKLFGAAFPVWFGAIGLSMYSLFQIMTLESWSMGIVRPVMEQFPYAWAFFIPFILVSTFTMLNLFIAIIVDAMQTMHTKEHDDAVAEMSAAAHDDAKALAAEIAGLRADVRALAETVRGGPAGTRPAA